MRNSTHFQYKPRDSFNYFSSSFIWKNHYSDLSFVDSLGEKSLALDSVLIFSLITCRVPPKKGVDWHIFHSFHTHEIRLQINLFLLVKSQK